MESILDYLKRRLLEVGPQQWERIASDCGVSKTLPRKIAYGDRQNPGLKAVQKLLDHFGVSELSRKAHKARKG